MVNQLRLLLLPFLYKKNYFISGRTTKGISSYDRLLQKHHKMHDEYVEINGIPTRILTFGKWIEEPFDAKKELILVITGNPGLPGFYINFATTLFMQLNKNVPIWIIGHAGHDEPSDTKCNSKIPPLKGNEATFCLQGQLKHKTEFIEKYIPNDVKIHMIGHSVGAWSILQLLKVPEIQARLHHAYLLFPTIERMKDSAAGKMFDQRSKSFQANMIFSLFGFITYLPHALRAGIIGHFIRKWNLPEAYLEEALKSLRTSAIERMLEMGRDQVGNVYDLDVDVINTNLNHMTFYYGTRDHWVPTQYFHDLKERCPTVDAYLDEHNMAHAFNIRNGPLMAEIIAGWISNRRVCQSDDESHASDISKSNETGIENVTVTVQ